MAPLFSKVGLNKLGHDVQNEETLICAKFGKDLFNIYKVIGRKKVAQFFDSQCILQLVGRETQCWQESPAVADKPARRESMPKIAPIRRLYNVVADNTDMHCFTHRKQQKW